MVESVFGRRYSTYERINSVSPRTLLKIVLYSHMNGDYSARSMKQNCKREIKEKRNDMLTIGAHMSIAKGWDQAAESVVKMNANTMQVFSRNPRGSNFKEPSEKEREKFQRIRSEHSFGPLLAHAPYTMNLASGKNEVYEFACRVIREDISRMDALGICLDTCHVFAAGYDIVNDLDGVLASFDQVIGLERLKAIHLNDSMMPLGSRKDRHAALGEGEIGMDSILNVLQHTKLGHLPFYLETPFDDAGHKDEIAMLRAKLY